MAQFGSSSGGKIKAVLFDFMGTCLDWHTSIIAVLPFDMTPEQRADFALNWRQAYFEANAARIEADKPPEDIDLTHRRVLDELLGKHPEFSKLFTDEVKDNAVRAWHHQKAWSDVSDAITKLRGSGYEIFVHANGTTRLQLDLLRSSGLKFDMAFSSQLLGAYKPAPENYIKALELLKLSPENCVTVAAHAYDLRGAKAVGMKTVYVYRWSDDILEGQEEVKKENDAYLQDMRTLHEVIAKL